MAAEVETYEMGAYRGASGNMRCFDGRPPLEGCIASANNHVATVAIPKLNAKLEIPMGSMNSIRLITLNLVVLCSAAVSSVCQTYQIDSDWSGTSNPNGVWSYGRKWAALDLGMDLFNQHTGSEGWFLGGTGGTPSIPDKAILWPWNNGKGLPCVRWTCPKDGLYHIIASFQGVDPRGGDVLVCMAVNGTSAYTNRVQAYSQLAKYDESIFLMRNAVVDFTVAWAGTGDPNASGRTKVAAAIQWEPYDYPALVSGKVVNGFFVTATVTSPGQGYTNAPRVRILGGGGSGAEAVAVVSNKMVVSLTITNPGKGYTNAPLVIVDPPYLPQPLVSIAARSEVHFGELTSGNSYQFQARAGNGFVDLGNPFVASEATFGQTVSGYAMTNDYRLATAPVPRQATASAQVVGGFVVGFAVTDGGSGYSTAPEIVILSKGGNGNGARATAILSGGSVVRIEIEDPGIGYINGANVSVAPPPTSVLWPTRVSHQMQLDLGSRFFEMSLSPYDGYRLQWVPRIGDAWTNLGPTIVPTAWTNRQIIDVNEPEGYFRLLHVP